MTRSAVITVFLTLISVFPFPAVAAQDAKTFPAIEVENFWPQDLRIDGTVTFVVRGILGLPAEGDTSPKKLVPFIDGVPLKDNFPDYIDVTDEQVRFTLRVTDQSRPAWASVAGFRSRPVALSVGWPNGGPAPLLKADPAKGAPAAPEQARFRPSPFRIIVFLLFSAGVLLATILLACKSNLLRDRAFSQVPAETFTFSLARTQMAWWLVITAVSFLYIWAFTAMWSFTVQALILIGISATTGVTAVLVDANNQGTARQKRAALLSEIVSVEQDIGFTNAAVSSAVRAGAISSTIEKMVQLANSRRLNVVNEQLSVVRRQVAPPTSKSNFFKDILSDSNGISFTRFQHLIWTLILGAMFLYYVITTLQMPIFDEKLLWLLGISGGAYVGFKFPEHK